jgi:hypothetical protein
LRARVKWDSTLIDEGGGNILRATASAGLAAFAYAASGIMPSLADDSGRYTGKWETDSSQSKVVSQSGQLSICDRPREGPLTYVVSTQAVTVEQYRCETVTRKEGSFELTCVVGARETASISATIADGRITGTWHRRGGAVECGGTISLAK